MIMNNLFAFYTRKNGPIYFPGAPFLLAAIFMVLSAIFAARSFKREANRQV